MSIQLEEEVQRLREELQLSNQRLLEMARRLERVTRISNSIADHLVVLCEANLAGDVVLVMSKVEQFTQAYQRNRQSVGAVH